MQLKSDNVIYGYFSVEADEWKVPSMCVCL